MVTEAGPDVLRLRDELAAGHWGEVRSVSATYNKGVLNNGGHLIDLLHLLLGPLDVVVTGPAAAGASHDFVSRYFWPANGGDEDPVTGSIHAGLVPYWADRLGKSQLMAYQASARGGVLRCELKSDRVQVSGQARLYLKGEIYI